MAKIHQEVTFDAAPARVYGALVRGKEHAEFTGAPAEIGGAEGEAWSAYGGKIFGRQIELSENERIVQTWRAGDWPEAVHSVVRFELRAEGDKTLLMLDHDALPDGAAEHIDGGWEKMYWAPLRAYLAG